MLEMLECGPIAVCYCTIQQEILQYGPSEIYMSTVILEYDTVGFKWIMVEEYVTVDPLENMLQCGHVGVF